ncbi:hypothetical protein HOG17_04295 [Candidatus Peregrinibacteria bacterium]|jgi:hypothetical protein|nr:hypothetical protein [Candidatus Peregrinibacteria bacterium]MBT4147969.1 hypothetical protein [Candidatus Peregrinibacteria bacterium]MBT4456218.1 hypothetical protein [Candidatus Peregrinibacteria bacterium]
MSNDKHKPNLTSVPDPKEISPELQRGVELFEELTRRCGKLDAGTTRVDNLENFAEEDVHEPSIFSRSHTISNNTLITKYPERMSDAQKYTIAVGMPKLYKALEARGFPDFRLMHYPDAAMNSFGGIVPFQLEGFGHGPRSFGESIDPAESSYEEILAFLDQILDRAAFRTKEGVRRCQIVAGIPEEISDGVRKKAEDARADDVETRRNAMQIVEEVDPEE